MEKPERIEIPIGNGKYLVAERNPDTSYDREIFIFIETDVAVTQDIALVRPSYRYKPDGQLDWSDESVDVLVWGNENTEDFTEEFKIGVREEENADV